jgi:alkylation response protein AidB-like acyl-CoA dehydrogenase
MTRFTAPVADHEFLLRDVLGFPSLAGLDAFRHADWEVAQHVIAAAARFAEERLAPANAAGDTEGASLHNGRVRLPDAWRSAWDGLRRDGWLALDIPAEHGGQGLPRLLQATFAEILNGACVSFCMLPLMSRAAARLLLEHADPSLHDQFLPGLLAGDATATICISEAQAGSDVGRICTAAVPASDGTIRITGTKTWISYGDHELSPQIAHLLLARSPGLPGGTRGLSLFLVPKIWPATGERNNVQALSLEHKLGLRASPTCVLAFDGARAFPIGPAGRGLACLFSMVNTMRLEVALQGVALAGAATAAALRYAAERRQGGPADQPPVPIVRHPDVRRMLLTMKARTEGLRALVLETALQMDLAEHAAAAVEREAAAGMAAWLLPVCKACATDAATEVSNLAIQVHGGAGYVRDTGVEQYLRDARVGAIYEGTNGIQALDLVSRRLIRDRGHGLGLFLERVRQDLRHTADRPDLAAIRAAVADGAAVLERCAHRLLAPDAGDRERGAAATPFLKLAGLVGSGWMWLRMAAVATSDTAGHQLKQQAARFHAAQLMPEAGWLEQQVMAGADSVDGVSDDILTGTDS